MRGDWHVARDLGEQMVDLAEGDPDPFLRPEAHLALGLTHWLQGEFTQAHSHFEQGIAWYDRHHHARYMRLPGQDPGVVCHGADAMAWWGLGYSEQAHRSLEQALVIAQTVAHPFVLTYYHFYANLLYQFEFEPLSVQREAEAIIALARQHDFTYFLGMGMILRG